MSFFILCKVSLFHFVSDVDIDINIAALQFKYRKIAKNTVSD